LLAVGGEVGFGILAAKGQLLEIAEMLLVRKRERVRLGFRMMSVYLRQTKNGKSSEDG